MLVRMEQLPIEPPSYGSQPYGAPQEPAYRTRVITATVQELMELAPSTRNATQYNVPERKTGDQSHWYGAPSCAAAKERTRIGWPEGWEKTRLALRSLRLPALPKRRRTRFSDDGPDLNLDRYLDGADQCWNVRRRLPVPTVDVTVDIGGNAHVDADALFWRGAAAVALSDALENAGYRVRLLALSSVRRPWQSSDPNLLTRVRLKDYAEPLRPGHLAGAICTTALFRIGVFHAILAADEEANSGLGQSRDIPRQACAAVHVGGTIADAAGAQAALDALGRLRLDKPGAIVPRAY